MTLVDSLRSLVKDAGLYADLVYTFQNSMNVGFELTDTRESATLLLGGTLNVVEGLVEPAFKITLTSNLLDKSMNGDVDLFALAGRSHIDEKRPVDFEIYDNERKDEIMETIKGIFSFLLLPGKVKKRDLRLDLAGSAHGARPIPLVYWKDLRTAWYHVPAGSVLNKSGEKDPWPQAFIVLDGKGRLKLEDEEVELETSTTYYIPRNSLHQVFADQNIRLIWIAWDAP